MKHRVDGVVERGIFCFIEKITRSSASFGVVCAPRAVMGFARIRKCQQVYVAQRFFWGDIWVFVREIRAEGSPWCRTRRECIVLATVVYSLLVVWTMDAKGKRRIKYFEVPAFHVEKMYRL